MVSPRIYLVEDDHEVRGATRLLLQTYGYAVQDFEDSETLLEQTRGQGADCMILDIRLPGMSGIELLTVLRGQGIVTPVILVSAEAASHLEKGFQAGASHVLAKPYDADGLLALLAGLLRSAT